MNKKFQLSTKFTFDFTASLISLFFLAIPFTIIAIAIKLDSKGPIFFRQERVGKDGKLFRIWKFRTMITGAETKGLKYNVMENDPRITKVGNFLRSWGIDELPQLINILKGEMSIVGPRPTLKYQVDRYNDFQRKRLLVKPGITGWALIHGHNILSWKERIKYDVWYVDNWSFWLDLKIILKTFVIIFITREGVYGEGGINDDFLQDAEREVQG